jgi:hypothetical protein
MLCDELLRPVNKSMEFQCRPGEFKLSSTSANSKLAVRTAIGGYNQISSVIDVHTHTESGDLLANFNNTRVYVRLTIKPWKSVRLAVSPNERGVITLEYISTPFKHPGLDLNAQVFVSSQNLVPLCKVDLSQFHKHGWTRMAIRSRLDEEYALGGEFHGRLNCGLCTDVMYDTKAGFVWALAGEKSFGPAKLTGVWGIWPSRQVLAFELQKYNSFYIKVARENGRVIGSVASRNVEGQNLYRLALNTLGDFKICWNSKDADNRAFGLRASMSIPNLKVTALAISFKFL